MYLDVLEDPWALSENGIPFSDFSNQTEDYEVDGKKDLRVICSSDADPWFRSHSNKLPPASFPFRSHGEILKAYYLPTPCKEKQESDLTTKLGIGSYYYSIIQKGTVHRYTPELSEDDSEEAAVNNWISWSVRLFQELSSANHDLFEDNFSGISRKSWDTVMKQVLKDDSQEALMSLIVQLANDKKLRNVLPSISRTPRKILVRVRESMKISHIQQMDGACIREYARRPGYYAEEKAGPKQELLAVNRHENTDTLENRVYVWVLETIARLSGNYLHENDIFSASKRVKDVRKFGAEALQMKHSQSIENIASENLIHPVQPNYPLQMDRRYKVIYKAYQDLLHDQKVQDDAWEWQRVLWGCTARVIFYSLLLNSMNTLYSNFLYVKQESQQGRWLVHGNAPGPFFDDRKDKNYLIDCWDLDNSEEWLEGQELFPGAHDVGRTGCDAVIYNKKRKYLLLVWFTYGICSTSDSFHYRLQSCQKAVQSYITTLQRQKKFLSRVDGLILASAFRYHNQEKIRFSSSTNQTKISMIVFPNNSSRIMPRLKTEVKNVMGEFLE